MNTPNIEMLTFQTKPVYLTNFQRLSNSEVLRDITNIEKGIVIIEEEAYLGPNDQRMLLKDFQVKLAKRLAINKGEFKPEQMKWFDN